MEPPERLGAATDVDVAAEPDGNRGHSGWGCAARGPGALATVAEAITLVADLVDMAVTDGRRRGVCLRRHHSAGPFTVGSGRVANALRPQCARVRTSCAAGSARLTACGRLRGHNGASTSAAMPCLTNGDGVANGPGDGVEMSRMLVTCGLEDRTGCRRWLFEICAGQCPGDSNPDGGSPGRGIGQLYGTYPNKVGTRPIARYAMDWGLTLCRETGAPCP